MTSQYLWWQTGVIYQIYPRSFQDSNNDGIGDLPGIIRRLDYLKSLNINAIWLSPIYPSPMHDFGYDVSDYCNIHPMFGTLDDFDRLLEEVHKRGLKLILDLVPNHTSNEHPWFVESRSRRNNPKRNWYIWQDPAPNGGPPNNWLSFFGGPAWTFDEHTGQYYLHQFVSQQPELNYRHPDVLPAMLDNMRFWLNKGVDGFRVDVIWLMLKDKQFRDDPPNPDWDGVNPHKSLLHIHTQNLPQVHDIIKQMRTVLDEYDDRMMVGEIYLRNEALMKYYGENYDECHLPFNFQLIENEAGMPPPWQAHTIRKLVAAYEADLPPKGWPNWVISNHDRPRLATRVGPGQARVATMLLLTLRGTPTCYYGDELGLENVPIPPEKVQDPPAVNQPEIAHIVGRDPVRTPMQWDNSPNAGFCATGIEPWLPLAGNYAKRNVTHQERNPASMLNFFRALTSLRRAEPALNAGDYIPVDSRSENIFAYIREAPNADRFLIALNFSDDAHTLDLSRLARTAKIALATDMVRSGKVELSSLTLSPNEGLVLRL